MEGVKFSRKENPEDKHDKESKEEGRYGLSGSRRTGGVVAVHVIGAFGSLNFLILNVQRSDVPCKNTAQLCDRKLGCGINLNLGVPPL